MGVLLQVDQLSKRFGDLVLFEGLSLGISDGDHIGLIAKNGAGKTTLMNLLTDADSAEEGTITYRNDIRVGYLPQDPAFDPTHTVLETCFASSGDMARAIAQYEQTLHHGDSDEIAHWTNEMDRLEAWSYEQRITQILSQLQITDLDQPMGELSGGQQKRVALANTLILEPDLFILDEPTNHLDLPMIEWLENYLGRSTAGILMVTHDRYFLDRVCNRIIEIDQRQAYRYEGNYAYYLEKREARIATHQAEVEKARNLMRTELDWMRRQPQARGTKAKYRIDAFYELQAKSRQRRHDEQVSLGGGGGYIGKKIFEAKAVSKRFGDKVILDAFDYTFARWEKLGIIGDNGTGKSTFIRLLLGQIEPESGSFDIGETVRFGLFSQGGIIANDEMKVIEYMQEIAETVTMADGKEITVSQFLNRFLFPPAQQHNYIHKLSGGERRRLYLCSVLMRNPNFLVLDEPTNDLDIVTLQVLEEYLQEFRGCLIIISHDRYFMDKIVDQLLVFKGNGVIEKFPGHYSHYRAWEEHQRILKQEQSKERERSTAAASPPTPTQQREKRRLTFKEQQEWNALETDLPRLEARKKELEEMMSSGTLTPDALLQAGTEIMTLIDELDEKEMRWLELSEWA